MIDEGPLAELAAMFVVPAKSGVYLTKSEIIVLARLVEGSLRVSDRKRMLVDVLKSPDSPAGLDRLLGLLSELCAAHVARYDELATSFPSLEPLLGEQRTLACRTIERLEVVREELRVAVTPP